MDPNPYEAAQSHVESHPAGIDAKRSTRLFGSFVIVTCSALGLLVLSAAAHRFQFDHIEAYRRSPLIAVEVLGILLAFAIVPVALIRAIVLAFQRRAAEAVISLLIVVLAFVAFLAAILIDAPTLIYAT